MRPVYILLVFSVFTNKVFSQKKNFLSKINPGIEAGIIFTNIQNKVSDAITADFKTKAGFSVSVNCELPLITHLYFKPSIGYSLKGASVTSLINGGVIIYPMPNSLNTTINTSYVEIPLIIEYKKAFLNGNYFIGSGPYIAYQVGITHKNDPSTDLYLNNNPIYPGTFQFFNPTEDLFKKFDGGISFIGGYEFSNNLRILFTGQAGILNIWPSKKKDDPEMINSKGRNTLKTNSFGFSIGYNF